MDELDEAYRLEHTAWSVRRKHEQELYRLALREGIKHLLVGDRVIDIGIMKEWPSGCVSWADDDGFGCKSEYGGWTEWRACRVRESYERRPLRDVNLCPLEVKSAVERYLKAHDTQQRMEARAARAYNAKYPPKKRKARGRRKGLIRCLVEAILG